MRKLVFALLLCATITSCNPLAAQLGIDGLQLGGDAPMIQAPRKRAVVSAGAPTSAFPTGWLFYLRNAPTYYVPGGSGEVAAWTDPDTGIAATQSVHIKKPVVSGKGIEFYSASVDSFLAVPPVDQNPDDGEHTSGSGTFALAIKLGALSGTQIDIACYGTQIAPFIGIESSAWEYYDSYGGGYLSSDAAISENGFYVYVYRAGYTGILTGEVWKNGSPLGGSNFRITWRKPFTIGNQINGGYAARGILYAIAHWNRYLTDTEIGQVTSAWTAEYQ